LTKLRIHSVTERPSKFPYGKIFDDRKKFE